MLCLLAEHRHAPRLQFPSSREKFLGLIQSPVCCEERTEQFSFLFAAVPFARHLRVLVRPDEWRSDVCKDILQLVGKGERVERDLNPCFFDLLSLPSTECPKAKDCTGVDRTETTSVSLVTGRGCAR